MCNNVQSCTILSVRMKGLEPPRPKAQDPKSCAATNYATSAVPWVKRTAKIQTSDKIFQGRMTLV